MKKGKFDIAHVPVGSVVKVQMFDKDPPMEHTVAEVAKNGPDSYIIRTNTPGTVTEFAVFNINHVVEVVKRGSGSYSPQRDDSYNTKFMTSEALDFVGGQYGFHKHPSQYVTGHMLSCYLSHICTQIANDTMLVDIDELKDLLVAGGHIHLRRIALDPEYNDNYVEVLVINKKKLKKAIRRVINKACANHKQAQKERDQPYRDMMEDDMRRSMYDSGFDGEPLAVGTHPLLSCFDDGYDVYGDFAICDTPDQDHLFYPRVDDPGALTIGELASIVVHVPKSKP